MSTNTQIQYKKNIEREITLERLSGPRRRRIGTFYNLRRISSFFHFTRLNSEINFLVFKVILTIRNKAKYTSILILYTYIIKIFIKHFFCVKFYSLIN